MELIYLIRWVHLLILILYHYYLKKETTGANPILVLQILYSLNAAPLLLLTVHPFLVLTEKEKKITFRRSVPLKLTQA